MWASLGEAYIARTQKYRRGAPRFIDKNPNNFIHAGLIRLILPNARIINAKRHPIDSCFGSFKQLFAKGQPFTYDLTEIGEYYVQYQRVMDHWHEVMPGFVLDVQYEDVVNDVEGQVRRILDFCGLPFEAGCVNFHTTQRAVKTASSEQVRQPIYSSSVNLWQRYESHLGELLDILEPLVEARSKPWSLAARRSKEESRPFSLRKIAIESTYEEGLLRIRQLVARKRTNPRGSESMFQVMHKPKFQLLPLTAAVASVLVPSPHVMAQEGAMLEEVIVSARKRTESVQDIPASVQALSGEDIAQMGARGMEDFTRFMPSVNVLNYGNGSSSVIFRGATIDGGGYVAQATSSVYLDEISITSTGAQPTIRMVDIAQVEALAGPQGAIYGSDAQAGTLRIITQKPQMNEYQPDAGWLRENGVRRGRQLRWFCRSQYSAHRRHAGAAGGGVHSRRWRIH